MSKVRLTRKDLLLITVVTVLVIIITATIYGAFYAEPQVEIGTALTCTLEADDIMVCTEQ